MEKNYLYHFTNHARDCLESLFVKKVALFGFNESSFHEVQLNQKDNEIREKIIIDFHLASSNYSYFYHHLIDELSYFYFIRIVILRYIETNLPQHKKKELYRLFHVKMNEREFFNLFYTLCNHLKESHFDFFWDEKDYFYQIFPEGMIDECNLIQDFINQVPEKEIDHDILFISKFHQYYGSYQRQAYRKVKTIKKEHIPTLSQIFTPEWIVKYLTENSLGRYYLDKTHSKKFHSTMQYYVTAKEKFNKTPNLISLEQVKVIEPCCGTGNILLYSFDLLYQMYLEQGYPVEKISSYIINYNLYGLDIDSRAAKICSLVLTLKALEKNPNFLTEKIKPNIYEIQDSSEISIELFNKYHFSNNALKTIQYLIKIMANAKILGSLIQTERKDYQSLLNEISTKPFDSRLSKLRTITQVAILLSMKYDVMITNPPYLGTYTFEKDIKNILSEHFPNSKTEFSCMFMERNFVKNEGYFAIVNPDSWMFLSSFQQMRKDLLSKQYLVTMMHLGMGCFDAVVQTTAFIIQNFKKNTPIGTYFDLTKSKEKEKDFLLKKNRYNPNQNMFFSITGTPIAYWASPKTLSLFSSCQTLNDFVNPRQGIATGNNEKNLRLWYEVQPSLIKWDAHNLDELFLSKKKYVPYNKGGMYRKWFYDMEWVLWFDKENYKNLCKVGNHLPSKKYYFKECITWSKVTSGYFSMRYVPIGSVFDVAGCSIFSKKDLYYVLGYSNSVVMQHFLSIFSQTLNYEVGNVKSVPFIYTTKYHKEIETLVEQNIQYSKEDLKEKETSPLFERSPLLLGNTISSSCNQLKKIKEERFYQLKTNEERLNQLFLKIYGLEQELPFTVNDKTVSVKRFDKTSEIKSFLSYFIGCVFHRFSPTKCRIQENEKNYTYILLEKSNDKKHDVISLLEEFLKENYSKDYLEENLSYIASALPRKGDIRSTIRSYFQYEFYKDHVKMYQKRPIYWLIISGRKNPFKVLIYYFNNTPEVFTQLDKKIKEEILNNQINKTRSAKQIKELETLRNKIKKLCNLKAEISYDDNITNNYKKFSTILASFH